MSHLLAISKMLFVVGEHTTLGSARSVVLRLFNVVSDFSHERLEVGSSHINDLSILLLIAFEERHAGRISELGCDAQVEVLAVGTLE